MNRTNAQAIIELLIRDIEQKAEASRVSSEAQVKEAKAKLDKVIATLKPTDVKVCAKVTRNYNRELTADYNVDIPKLKKVIAEINEEHDTVRISLRSPLGRNYGVSFYVSKKRAPAFNNLSDRITDMALALLTSDDEAAQRMVREVRNTIERL